MFGFLGYLHAVPPKCLGKKGNGGEYGTVRVRPGEVPAAGSVFSPEKLTAGTWKSPKWQGKSSSKTPGLDSMLLLIFQGVSKGCFSCLKLAARIWKWMVGTFVSFWDGVFSGAKCSFQGGYSLPRQHLIHLIGLSAAMTAFVGGWKRKEIRFSCWKRVDF